MIIMTTDTTLTPGQNKRLRRIVDTNMKANKHSGRSASGVTALMAIQWCERQKLPWRLTGSHELGYYVEVMEQA